MSINWSHTAFLWYRQKWPQDYNEIFNAYKYFLVVLSQWQKGSRIFEHLQNDTYGKDMVVRHRPFIPIKRIDLREIYYLFAGYSGTMGRPNTKGDFVCRPPVPRSPVFPSPSSPSLVADFIPPKISPAVTLYCATTTHIQSIVTALKLRTKRPHI